MGRRRWRCFKDFKPKGYQKKRSRSHRKEFVRGGADPKITRFDVGNREKLDWEAKVALFSEQNVMISHFSLEALRVNINRRLTKNIGRQAFHLKIRKHPYTVYREHAMMSFAGADRLSSGMRNGFGRPVGRCSRTRGGDVIMECGCAYRHVNEVKRAFEIAQKKLCVRTTIFLKEVTDESQVPRIALPYWEKFIWIRGT